MNDTDKRILAQNIMARYDLPDDNKLFLVFQLYKDDLKDDLSKINISREQELIDYIGKED